MLIRYPLICFVFLLPACQSNSFESNEGVRLDYETCVEIAQDSDKTHKLWRSPDTSHAMLITSCNMILNQGPPQNKG